MSYINTYPKKNSNILRINFEKDIINVEPNYQRNGDIWNLDKRQLLIDSIINDYDIPKLYFHVLDQKTSKKTGKQYSVIDGRQRLETIWSFIKGEFPLADDFIYYKDNKVNAKNLTYKDLANHYPDIKSLFDSFILPIMCVETDDLELIDDMFLRLNEAVPLNAAEKRNAIGGPMVRLINKVSEHPFFRRKVKFSNKRYQHKEVAARLLFLIHSIKYEHKIIDTKKAFLDNFVKVYKETSNYNPKFLETNVMNTLNAMNEIFINDDKLLRSQGMVPIYFLIVNYNLKTQYQRKISRKKLLDFDTEINKNLKIAEKDISKASFDLLEFDKLSVHGTNDPGSIRERVRILSDFLGLKTALNS